jgi:hypothetical protein
MRIESFSEDEEQQNKKRGNYKNKMHEENSSGSE